jgi:hypothetical protein
MRARPQLGALKDGKGREVHSEKVAEVHFKDDAPSARATSSALAARRRSEGGKTFAHRFGG